MYQPLADLLRPQTLDDVVGQEHILGEGAVLRRLIQSGNIPNMVFYGPSGTGIKQTARLTAFREASLDICLNSNTVDRRHGKDHRSQHHRQADQSVPL